MAALHACNDSAAARFGIEAERDLGQPLTVLLGFIETVRDLRLDPRLSRDYLDLMEEQCKRMQRIIEYLLQLSTLESAPEPPADERMDVRVLLARIRTDAEVLSGGRHRIVLDVEDGFDLLGAQREIASAFGNLAGNGCPLHATRRSSASGIGPDLRRGELRMRAPTAEPDRGGKAKRQHLAHWMQPYLSRMSFLTELTPLTARASSTALFMLAVESTKPLSCTTFL